jgi:hypothetical protein
MNQLLTLAAFAEARTGVILLAYPPIVARLLFDAESAGAGVVMSPAGAALIGLGAACWPGDLQVIRYTDNVRSSGFRSSCSWSGTKAPALNHQRAR